MGVGDGMGQVHRAMLIYFSTFFSSSYEFNAVLADTGEAGWWGMMEGLFHI